MAAISFGTLFAFAATCFVIELTPGPNMAYLAVLSTSNGRRAGFAATLGVSLGLLIVGLAAAVGLTAIIVNSRWIYEALRWSGVLYLLWLAWEGWRGEEETSPGSSSRDVAIVTAHPTSRDRSSATVGLQGGPIGRGRRDDPQARVLLTPVWHVER